MKLCVILLSAALVCLIAAKLFGQATSPVSVEIVAPTTGQVVSNTITFTAIASSTVAPITKVEFYRDGILMGTVYAKPNNLRFVRP